MMGKSQGEEKKIDSSFQDEVQELAEFFPGYEKEEIRKVLSAKPSFQDAFNQLFEFEDARKVVEEEDLEQMRKNGSGMTPGGPPEQQPITMMESEELNLTDDELFLRFHQFRERKLKEA